MSHSIFDDRIRGLTIMLDFPGDLAERLVRLFHDVSQYKQLPKGAVIFAESDAGSDAGYVLLSGVVQVERGEHFRRKVAPPALLGEMRQFQLEGSEQRSATVRALEDIEVFRFEWPAFYAALAASSNEDEAAIVRNAIKQTAWLHYLDQDGEL